MSAKKPATSATQKASTAAKKAAPATTPAAPAPKTEVEIDFFCLKFIDYFSFQKKVEVVQKPAAAAQAPAAPAKPKATAPTTKTSSLAKTSTKVTKKTTTTKTGGKKKAKSIKYFIDCTHPVEDGIFDLNAFVRTSFFPSFEIFVTLELMFLI